MSYGGNKNKKTFEDVELPTNPNLPVWLITPKEEKLIFERWRKKAFARCDDLIQAYVKCSNSYKNPVEGMRMCDEANKASMGCVAKYQKQEYLDIEREILIDEKIVKKKKYKEFLKSLEDEKKKAV
ncbi:uncharacterized protein CANTADRAFT_56055 [Suhomyces tanzawaensis NRRL Y-17324]|uniref:COX assembly mitochondrial protein n=1 Tax=Suhomyces tanzawaensis NRRL Y-17324 TaxID=984487 RepID=A0A1E4SCU9_9ASCO|nr:uncharacterized protein CANTADRAFT_56055 [Suhomyces tanzawaensis NRRL Y-17324]ODV77288.1 hypothetical protein CANTADRAFT_56055 [Suhomyces tanzawaensis NRRL Y-17324]